MNLSFRPTQIMVSLTEYLLEAAEEAFQFLSRPRCELDPYILIEGSHVLRGLTAPAWGT